MGHPQPIYIVNVKKCPLLLRIYSTWLCPGPGCDGGAVLSTVLFHLLQALGIRLHSSGRRPFLGLSLAAWYSRRACNHTTQPSIPL